MAQVLPGGLQEIPSTTPPVAVNGTEKQPPATRPVPPVRAKTRNSTMESDTTSKDHLLQTPDDVLWDAVCKGDRKQVSHALQRGADPRRFLMFDTSEFSEVVHSYKKKNSTALKFKKYMGSMVSAAVMSGHVEIVTKLVEYGGAVAGPASYYSFKAGLRKVDFEGPPTFAVFIKNDVRMIRELVRLKANLSEKAKLAGKENNTLLWNASYAGSTQMVSYLMDNIPDMVEEACAHQDDGAISHTPLHIASLQGHAEVVRILLKRGAKLRQRGNEVGMTPLTDAIDRDHAPVVKALVQHHADILSKDSLHWLFRERNNMVTIEAAADGLLSFLKDKPELFQKTYMKGKNGGKPKLTSDHVVQFFNTPGDAPMHMIDVIFQKRTINYKTYRELEDGHVLTGRRVYKNAHIPITQKFNVTVGPDVEYWNRKFEMTMTADNQQQGNEMKGHNRRYETPQERRFRESLLPQQDDAMHVRPSRANAVPMQVPIDIYQCVLSGIHRDAEVLFAITEQEGDMVFKAYGIQAILELAWQAVWKRYTVHLVIGLVQCALFFRMSVVINMSVRTGLGTWDYVSLVCMSLCWILGVRQEVGQIFGYWMLGKLSGYLRDYWNIIDWARLVMTGTVILMLWRDHECFVNPDSKNYRPFRQMLAIVVFFRWIRVLNACRGYRFAGQDMLPILRAFQKIYPFFFVVLFPLLGFFHAYFCFGIYGEDIYRTFSIVYRIGFTGDFDVEEMEDADGHYQTEMNDGMETHMFIDPEQGIFWFSLRVFLIVCTLWLTVAMMNIFIGVLSEAYNDARRNSEEIFWRSRARIVFDEQAQIAAEKAVLRNLCRLCPSRCCRRCCGQLPRAVSPEFLPTNNGILSITEVSEEGPPTPQGDTGVTEDAHQDDGNSIDFSTWDHVWYCCQADFVAGISDGVVNDSDQAVTHKDFEEMKEGMHSTFANLNQAIGKQGKDLMEEMHLIERITSDFGLRAQTAPQPGQGQSQGGAVIRHNSEPARERARDPALARHATAWPMEDTEPKSSMLGSCPLVTGSQQAVAAVQQAATNMTEGAWQVVKDPLKQVEGVMNGSFPSSRN